MLALLAIARVGGNMTKEEAGALVAPFYKAFETGEIALLDRVFAPDWTDHTLPPGRPPGLAGLKQAVGFVRAVLPDVTATMEHTVFDGTTIVVRITFRGTNTGGFPGVGPNGAAVAFIAFDMHLIAGGRVAESWHLEDNLSLMIQAGVVPPPG
jgi:predicted ester cyclase